MTTFDNSTNYRVSKINIDLIITDDTHSYTDEEIDELARSIENDGMIQNIIVIENEDNTYKLLSGHKRLQAYIKLFPGYKDMYSQIPAFILNKDSFNIDLPISEESKKLYVITLINLMQKNKANRDTYKEFLTLQSIFTEAKNNGYKFGDRLRRILSYQMKLSATTIGRMEFVQKHACEATVNALTSNKISINQAESIAAKPKEEQEKIINDLLTAPEKRSDKTPNALRTISKQDYVLLLSKCNELKDTCDSISTLLSSRDSYEVNVDTYNKFHKLTEDMEKTVERMEAYHTKLMELLKS